MYWFYDVLVDEQVINNDFDTIYRMAVSRDFTGYIYLTGMLSYGNPLVANPDIHGIVYIF